MTLHLLRLGATRLAIYPSKAALIDAAADNFVQIVNQALAARGCCSVALAGGSTPRDLYSRLAQRRDEIEWSKLQLFWGDERAVPPDSPQSNYRMAKEFLLDDIPIPAQNVHRMRGEIDPNQAASEYSGILQEAGIPLRLDLALLGVGTDGHTASLFPGTTAVEEGQADVAAVFVDKLESWRITLTLPLLNRSRQVIFLVAGASKADIVGRIHSLPSPKKEYPASLVQPGRGRLLWMLDEEAAGSLERGDGGAEEDGVRP